MKAPFVSAGLGALAFASFFYRNFGFEFGRGNNVEELPVIYRLAGLVPYSGDAFVEAHVLGYNPATPYFWLTAKLAQWTGIAGLPLGFFLVHVALLVLIYLSLRAILRRLSGAPEVFCFLAICGIAWLDHAKIAIPNARTLFFSFLDPESVAFGFAFAAIAAHLAKRFRWAAVLLFCATLAHPLYALPVMGACLVASLAGKKTTSVPLFYALAVLPYCAFLYFKIQPKLPLPFDPLAILEIVRSPHHYHVLTLGELPKKAGVFVIFGLLAILVRAKKSGTNWGTEADFQFRAILVALFAYLICASFVATIGHVEFLVHLTPYRVGVLVVPLAAVRIAAVAWSYFEVPIPAAIRAPSPVCAGIDACCDCDCHRGREF